MEILRKYFVFLLIVWTMTVGLANPAAAVQWHKVKWVIDGDTLFLQDGRHIRIIGINAPEVAHDDQPAEPFGETAKRSLEEIVDRGHVRLEWDQEQSDHFGRKLAHVFDEDNRLVSQEMVARGLAYVLFQKENQRYFERLLKNQQEAMAKKHGFWRAFKQPQNQDVYLGNRNSLRFHAASCSESRKISHKNRITFKDSRTAFENGYAPAKECLHGIGAFLQP